MSTPVSLEAMREDTSRIHDAVARLEVAVRGNGVGMTGHVSDHEQRLRCLEHWRAALPLSALAAVAAAILSAVAAAR